VHPERLFISKVMVEVEQEIFFLFSAGSQPSQGFRSLERDNWGEEVAWLWRELMLV
jgi:hypothetical protein